MRDFTLVQDINGSVEEYWSAFLDPAFEQAIVVALRYREYEILEHEETEASIRHKVRAVPRLDVTSAVTRLVGARFGYLEEGEFDKKVRIWRARTFPDAFSGRLSCDMVMHLEPAGTGGAAASRRLLDYRVDARIAGIGGMVESGLERTLRAGWLESAAFMNDWLRRARRRG